MEAAEARRPCARIAAQRATSSISARQYRCNASLRGSSPEHARADNPPPVSRRRGSVHGQGVRRDPLPQRGGDDRALRHGGARGARGAGLGGRGDRGRQRLGRRQRRARARRPAPWWCTSRGAATAAPTCAGFAAAQGDYIVMADADLTYDFGDIPRFVDEARRRRRPRDGRPHEGHPARRDALAPPLRRATRCSPGSSTSSSAPACATPTAACARSGARRCPALDLRTTGMEFASEMVIRAGKERLEIEEIPIHYHPREGESKLSSFRDGWRHLRFLLVHSPTWLFIVPGAAMAVLGTLIALTVLLQVDVLGRAWDLHTMVGGALLMIVGTQVLALGLCAHAYGTYFMGEKDPWFDRMRARFRLEHGLLLGGAVVRGRPRGRRRDPRDLGRPRLRRALRGAARRARGDADHRRHPDLLLLLPAQHPRPAPAPLAPSDAAAASLAALSGAACPAVARSRAAGRAARPHAPARACS